ncbi:2Fe-2S iron-sulfur cluster-binding protein [Gulosibacter sediminis]|uniref:2Fe-2S iron-sulfur cluster-binding protein n=1 Tax=Gulosibacter sediminis TaxID=1729695 RepID=UPI00186682B5|nr:2Fe-2S iron-sulfur cluster-binding protein [Gulosibacter sediminis]
MPSITYRRVDGTSATVVVDEGTSIMRAALQNDVAGIVGECGGQAMCATCHVYVPDGVDLPEVSEDEDEMLECTTSDRLDNSRLGCQLLAGRDFDELTVDLPESQV